MIVAVNTKIQFNVTNTTNVTMVLQQRNCAQTVWYSTKLFAWRTSAINHSTLTAKTVLNCVSDAPLFTIELFDWTIFFFIFCVQNQQREQLTNAHVKTVSSLTQTQVYATFSTTALTATPSKLLALLDYTLTNTPAPAFGQTQLTDKDAKPPRVNYFCCLNLNNILVIDQFQLFQN